MTRPLRHRYLWSRRVGQLGLLVLMAGGNFWGWQILRGNLSQSSLLGTVPLADPLAVLQLLAAGGLLAVDALLGAAIAVVFYGLIGGRVFCSWVCPVNAVTDLANWLAARLGWRTGGPGLLLSRRSRHLALVLTLVLSAVLGTAAFEMISPIGFLHRGVVFGATAGSLVVVAVFLFDLAVQKNGFCGHLCPLGAFYTLVGRFSLLRVAHDHRKCTDCLECVRVCPEPQVLKLVGQASGSILPGECTNCGRCIEVCDDDALRFAYRKQAISLTTGGL